MSDDPLDDLAALGLPAAAAPLTSPEAIRARALAIAPLAPIVVGWSTGRLLLAATAAMTIGTGLGAGVERLRHAVDVLVVPRLVAVAVPADAPAPLVVERERVVERVVTVVRRVDVPGPAATCEAPERVAEIPEGWIDDLAPPQAPIAPSPSPEAEIVAPEIARVDPTPDFADTRWRVGLGASAGTRPGADGVGFGPIAAIGLSHAFGDGGLAPLAAVDVSLGGGVALSPGIAAEVGGSWRRERFGVDFGWTVASRLVTGEPPQSDPRRPPVRERHLAMSTGPALSAAVGPADGTRVRSGVSVRGVSEPLGAGLEAIWTVGIESSFR